MNVVLMAVAAVVMIVSVKAVVVVVVVEVVEVVVALVVVVVIMMMWYYNCPILCKHGHAVSANPTSQSPPKHQYSPLPPPLNITTTPLHEPAVHRCDLR